DALGPVDGARRRAIVVTVTARPVGERGAVQALDEEVGDDATAVEALVDDDSLPVDLRVVLLGEFLDAGGGRVGHVDVGDAPARGLRHLVAGGVPPSAIAQRGLARGRLHDVGAGPGRARGAGPG